MSIPESSTESRSLRFIVMAIKTIMVIETVINRGSYRLGRLQNYPSRAVFHREIDANIEAGEAETVTSPLQRHGPPWVRDKFSLVISATLRLSLVPSLFGGLSIIGTLRS